MKVKPMTISASPIDLSVYVVKTVEGAGLFTPI